MRTITTTSIMYATKATNISTIINFRQISTCVHLFSRKRTDSWSDPEYGKTKIDFPPVPPVQPNDFGEPFRRLEIIPPKKADWVDPAVSPETFKILPPRWTRMKPTQDWTSVWPTAHTFKASVVPLPIRMGYLKKSQRQKRPPPGKEANLELMKIPNFLHLTPLAIEKHCKALKKFCTKFPEELSGNDEMREKHFPLEVTTHDFVSCGPSLRDPRSRIVHMSIRLSNMTLDEHARVKFIKLVGNDRYDKKTDTVTIVMDRCPARHQNRDYGMYLLTALFHQSWKVEKWETEIDELDRVFYVWQGTKSKKLTFEYLKKLAEANATKQCKQEIVDQMDCKNETKNEAAAAFNPAYLQQQTTTTEKIDDSYLDEQDLIKSHSKIMQDYFENGETVEIVRQYAQSVRKMLGVP